MGILASPKSQEKSTGPSSKRRSVQTDFANLAPLKPGGVLGFSTFRDSTPRSPGIHPPDSKSGSKKDTNGTMDSDDDDDVDDVDNDDYTVGKLEDIDVKETNTSLLSPEDAKRQIELAEGVRKIKVHHPPSSSPSFDTRLTNPSLTS